MPNRSSKNGRSEDPPTKRVRPSRDPSQFAFDVVREATGENENFDPEKKQKNPHAVALGRLGGKKGGKARAAKLTAKERQEIARKAAKARWANRDRLAACKDPQS